METMYIFLSEIALSRDEIKRLLKKLHLSYLMIKEWLLEKQLLMLQKLLDTTMLELLSLSTINSRSNSTSWK